MSKTLRELELESLRLDCAMVRIRTMPWFNVDSATISMMVNMGENMMKSKSGLKLNPSNVETLSLLKLELARRN